MKMVGFRIPFITVIEKYMAQSLHIGLRGPFTNLPFGICAIYFDPKVNVVYITQYLCECISRNPNDFLF